MERILVSACLLGAPSATTGAPRMRAAIFWSDGTTRGAWCRFARNWRAAFPCRAPRPRSRRAAAGRRAGRPVADRSTAPTRDVTEGFRTGAAIAVRLARDTRCRLALLTEGSPSCGVARIHSRALRRGRCSPAKAWSRRPCATRACRCSSPTRTSPALAPGAGGGRARDPKKPASLNAVFIDRARRLCLFAGLHRRFHGVVEARVMRPGPEELTEKSDVEADLSALEPRAQAPSRVPCPHGHQGRPARS